MPENYAEKVERLRQERRAATKKRARQNTRDKILTAALISAGVLAIIAVIAVLGGIVTMLAWNYGVVAVVAAAGGSVGKIGFWTAVCINIAIGIIRTIFSPPAAQVKT